MYCSASQLSMSLKHVLLLVQPGSFNTRLALLLLLLLLLLLQCCCRCCCCAAAAALCSLILMHFCLRQPLILLFWAARHNDAEMQQEHDPLCGCMATAATKERCAALGPRRIQRAVAHQYVQESLLMVGSNRPLGQVCLVLNNSWRHTSHLTMVLMLI